MSVLSVFNVSYIGFVPVFDRQDAMFKGCKTSSCSLVSSTSWNDTWHGHPAAGVLLQLAGLDIPGSNCLIESFPRVVGREDWKSSVKGKIGVFGESPSNLRSILTFGLSFSKKNFLQSEGENKITPKNDRKGEGITTGREEPMTERERAM